jgi:hypothetical protein
MTNELAGATTIPAPNASQTPGEFAALWNSRTAEQRTAWIAFIRENHEKATRCWLEQHERNDDAWQAGYNAAEAKWAQALRDA